MPESIKNSIDGDLYEKCLNDLESKGDARYGICLAAYKEHHEKDALLGKWVRKEGHKIVNGEWQFTDAEGRTQLQEIEMEIFKGGKQIDSTGQVHDGDSLIDKAVQSFDKDSFQPPLRLDHKDGPAYGWVESLKTFTKNGIKFLYAKVSVIPEIIDIIKRRLYETRSAGFYADGKLNHIALLGASTPAVKGLGKIILSENFCDAPLLLFNEDKHEDKHEEKQMEENIQAGQQDKHEDKTLKEFQEKILKEKEKEIKTIKQEYEQKLKDLRFEQSKKEIKNFIDNLVSKGKITPAVVDGMQQFCESLIDHQSEIEVQDKKITNLEWFKDFISARTVSNSNLFSEIDKSQVPVEPDKKVSLLIAEKQNSGLSYKEALLAVNDIHPELFEN